MTNGWPLVWSHGHGCVETVGGMLGPVHFCLPGGREVQPFAIFPWSDEAPPIGEDALTGLMSRGRGEWPCVPFGQGQPRECDSWNPPIHGEAAHGEWRRVDDAQDPARVRLRYECGSSGPVAALEREVAGVHGEAAVDCRLTVFARQACRLPIGLHPTLRLPARPEALLIRPGAFAFGLTYPREVEAGADIVASGAGFAELGWVPRRGGGSIDLRYLPLVEKTESLVQLCGIDGRMVIDNLDEDYRFALQWNALQLPSCVLWISNGGRAAWPWSQRHFALGIEPVCANFDLGVIASVSENEVSARGIAASMLLSPEEPLVIDYRLGVGEAK
jgi:hypothetical protein